MTLDCNMRRHKPLRSHAGMQKAHPCFDPELELLRLERTLGSLYERQILTMSERDSSTVPMNDRGILFNGGNSREVIPEFTCIQPSSHQHTSASPTACAQLEPSWTRPPNSQQSKAKAFSTSQAAQSSRHFHSVAFHLPS